jgi:hypothetical protein
MSRRLITGIAAVVAVAMFWAGHPDAQASGPVINGLSGSLADGATVQVSGSGFGTKATATPLKWDNFEAGANGSGLTNWDYFGTRPTYSSTVKRAKSSMSARANFVNGAWNSAFGVDGQHLPQIYIDAWYWLDSGPPYSRNHKPLRLMSGGGAEPHLAYVMFCDGASYLTSTVSASDGHWPALGPASFSKRWSHIQWYLQESSPGSKNGVMRMWVDGVLHVDKAVATRTSSSTRWESAYLGEYLGHDADANCAAYGDTYTYWDDVYFDTTQARVEIGDAPTYAASRHREIQIPSAWSASSITLTLNDGSFASFAGLYLYITDSSGRVNANGFPLQSGPDTTAPRLTTSAPANGASGIARTTTVMATFSEAMTASTIGTSTFELRDSANALVPAGVGYNTSTRVATLTPTAQLATSRTYTARVKGGSAGVKDSAGNALAADATWSFTTAAAADTVAPTITLTGPANGASVSGQVQLTATASDNVGVAGVRFKVDGVNAGSEDVSSPYAVAWDSTLAGNGSHTIVAVARDAGGNTTQTSSITVNVSNTPTVTAGLVAAYSFNEAAGTSALDASGRNNVGTLAGGARRSVQGRHGGAITFDGVDDMVNVADSASLDLTTGMTIEAWVRPTALSGWRTVIMKENPGGLAYVLYGHDNAPKPSTYVRIAGRSSSNGTGGSAALPLNTWTHLAATYDGAAVRLYVNGVEAGNAPVSGSLVTSTLPLRIGGNAVWGEFFSGLIDEVRIYNRALTAVQIRADMTTPIDGGGEDAPPATPRNLRIVP